ncbi:MAG: TatD family hydrolase [Kofleriaceae bacterium]
MIDFHCHLDLYPDPARVVAECTKRNIYVLSVTTTPAAWQGTQALAANSPRIRTALGLHPQLVSQRKAELPLLLKLIPEARYVGEVGLDAAPEFASSLADQIEVFGAVLRECATLGGRILSIHSRRATKQVLDMLARWPTAGTAVLHWFSGTERELQRASDLGCWFSVGPAMLRSQKGAKLVQGMPHERVLTETDGPFANINGRSALPWDAHEAAAMLSELWALTSDGAEERLLSNLRRLVTPLATAE